MNKGIRLRRRLNSLSTALIANILNLLLILIFKGILDAGVKSNGSYNMTYGVIELVVIVGFWIYFTYAAFKSSTDDDDNQVFGKYLLYSLLPTVIMAVLTTVIILKGHPGIRFLKVWNAFTFVVSPTLYLFLPFGVLSVWLGSRVPFIAFMFICIGVIAAAQAVGYAFGAQSRKVSEAKDRKRKALENGETVGCDNVNIRDDDIRMILTHIIRDVMKDRESLLESVLGTVKEVLRVCAGNNNAENIEKEIAKLEAKKEKLLDMCLSGDIETSDYKKASERISEEHASLLSKLDEEKANSALVVDKEQIIKSITEFVNSVAVGEEWDDIIYRNLVERIYVHKDRTLDIHLKLIPEKWQAKILKGKAEIEQYNQNQIFLTNGGTSMPTEVTKSEQNFKISIINSLLGF